MFIYLQIKKDFQMMMNKIENPFHNHLLENWDDYTSLILRKTFSKTKLQEFKISEDMEYTKGKDFKMLVVLLSMYL